MVWPNLVMPRNLPNEVGLKVSKEINLCSYVKGLSRIWQLFQILSSYMESLEGVRLHPVKFYHGMAHPSTFDLSIKVPIS